MVCGYENVSSGTRKMAMAGLSLGMLAACMDGTIVGTCANVIAADLKGLDLYSWMITTYLLCESAMVPIAGKMSDRYGRKPLFMLGLAFFAIGSMAAGLSVNMEMMIVCRGIQGMGGGIIMPVAMAAVADFYPPSERGKMQGMLGAMFGIGSGIGPLVGGFVCNSLSWHWIFYINIPIVILCLLFTFVKFPEQEHKEMKPIDYLGMVVLTALIFDVLLYFQGISDGMDLGGVKSIVMISFAVVMVDLFLLIENKVEDPVVAPKLAHNRTVLRAGAYMFIMGLAMIGTMTFNAMYLMNIYDLDAMQCGLCLLPLVFGMVFTSMGSGMMVNKTGYRKWVLAGSVLMTASLLLLSTIGSKPDMWIVLVYLFIFGLGLGCVNSTVMISVQNHTPIKDMGMTTSVVSLMRNIGSTVGTASFGVIIASFMNTEFAKTIYAPLAEQFGLSGTGLLAFKYIPGVPDELPGIVNDIFGNGVCSAYLFAGLLYVLGILLALRMDKDYTISKDVKNEQE